VPTIRGWRWWWASPFELFADYQPEVPEEDRRDAGRPGPGGHVGSQPCFSVHRGNPPKVTANLLAPIVICHGTMRGVQVMMKAGKYGVRHEVELLQKKLQGGA